MTLDRLQAKHDAALARAARLLAARRSADAPLREAVLLKCKMMKIETREERKAA